MTDPRHDARVNRAVSAAQSAGYQIKLLAPGHGISSVTMNVAKKLVLGSGFGLGGFTTIRAAETAFWSIASHRQAYQQAIAWQPDIVHAHDWDSLIIASRAAQQAGSKLIYDSHEFASGMHRERLYWQMTMSQAIKRLEAKHIRRADLVVTVSPGIATALKSLHGLAEEPTVIRNLPAYQPAPVAPPDHASIMLHYHGILAKGRGIEKLVEVMRHLPGRYLLQLLGPERQPGYLRMIKQEAARLGVDSRLQLLPAVPPDELIRHANTAHFGLCLLGDATPHYRHALPNKLFEYIMAGLFVVTSGSQDMASVVHNHNAGISLTATTPEQIAAQIKSVSESRLAATRKRNLETAKSLNWGMECQKLREIYEAMLT